MYCLCVHSVCLSVYQSVCLFLCPSIWQSFEVNSQFSNACVAQHALPPGSGRTLKAGFRDGAAILLYFSTKQTSNNSNQNLRWPLFSISKLDFSVLICKLSFSAPQSFVAAAACPSLSLGSLSALFKGRPKKSSRAKRERYRPPLRSSSAWIERKAS